MSDKKQPEKSPKSAKSEKVLTEAEKAEKVREEAAAEARKIAEATLSRYVSWVEKLKGRNVFRGQADAKWGLQSSAYRRLLNKRMKHPELAGFLFTGYLHERVNETIMRFPAHGDLQPLDMMARMQHHGAATGLIDFTESALAALWFACKDEQDKSGKVVAVRLDDGEKIQEIKKREDMKGKLEEFFPIHPDKKMWAWRPGDGDSRMVTQQSLFIFGRPEIEEEFVNDEFPISAEEKGRYMEILGRMGISENFIFSDFSGFSAANASGKDYALHLAEIYYAEKVKDAEKSKEDAEQAEDAERIKEASKNLSLYCFQKGNFNVAQSAYEEAIMDFDRAIECGLEDYVGVYCNRGNVLRNLGRHEEAIADYTRAIEIDPQAVIVYNNRGNVLGDLGRHEEALVDYTRAIDLNPQYAMAYNNRGAAYGNLNRDKEAVSDWNEAIRIGEQIGDEESIQNAQKQLAKHTKQNK